MSMPSQPGTSSRDTRSLNCSNRKQRAKARLIICNRILS
jgi:hypothetical protein